MIPGPISAAAAVERSFVPYSIKVANTMVVFPMKLAKGVVNVLVNAGKMLKWIIHSNAT